MEKCTEGSEDIELRFVIAVQKNYSKVRFQSELPCHPSYRLLSPILHLRQNCGHCKRLTVTAAIIKRIASMAVAAFLTRSW